MDYLNNSFTYINKMKYLNFYINNIIKNKNYSLNNL